MFKHTFYKLAILSLISAVLMEVTGGFDMAAQMAFVSAVVLALAPSFSGFVLTSSFGVLHAADDLTGAIAKAMKEMNDVTGELRGLGSELKAKHEAGEKNLGEVKGQVDDLLNKFGELTTSIKDMEQKAASGTWGTKNAQIKSVGEQFVESEGFKQFNGDGKMSVKATITTTLAGGAAGNGLMTPAYRDGDLVSIPRRVTIDDLIPTIQINSSSVDFARQLTRNNNAAVVAEGTQKPYSDYSWESATVPVRTLAHLAKVTRQAWEDAPRLMGEINSELIYGLDLLREAQILFGNNTGNNLHGLVPQARTYARPTGAPTTGLTRIDILRLAVLNIALRGYQADGLVLNAADWAYIELGKDNEGRYMLTNPQGGAQKRLWNLPVLDTVAMPQDSFLVGAFRIAASIYRRMGIEVKLSTENDKDFEFNLGTIRAEERIALGVKRRDALETGTFTAALA